MKFCPPTAGSRCRPRIFEANSMAFSILHCSRTISGVSSVVPDLKATPARGLEICAAGFHKNWALAKQVQPASPASTWAIFFFLTNHTLWISDTRSPSFDLVPPVTEGKGFMHLLSGRDSNAVCVPLCWWRHVSILRWTLKKFLSDIGCMRYCQTCIRFCFLGLSIWKHLAYLISGLDIQRKLNVG